MDFTSVILFVATITAFINWVVSLGACLSQGEGCVRRVYDYASDIHGRVRPLSDHEVPPHLAEVTAKWREMAREEFDYSGPVAWRVKRGISLFWLNTEYLDPDGFMRYSRETSAETSDAIVFWIHFQIEPSDLGVREQLRHLQEKYDLPPQHLANFGNAPLLVALKTTYNKLMYPGRRAAGWGKVFTDEYPVHVDVSGWIRVFGGGRGFNSLADTGYPLALEPVEYCRWTWRGLNIHIHDREAFVRNWDTFQQMNIICPKPKYEDIPDRYHGFMRNLGRDHMRVPVVKAIETKELLSCLNTRAARRGRVAKGILQVLFSRQLGFEWWRSFLADPKWSWLLRDQYAVLAKKFIRQHPFGNDKDYMCWLYDTFGKQEVIKRMPK